ncbi:DNA integrity scanning protein DisA nucleotide-binding domain protein [Candidatus Micrarchaeota archaeon]|nr:DNA integrity scanning protein DisA nucleotide-binding domain protein [Candidatus Micrarchaeota archaeon]
MKYKSTVNFNKKNKRKSKGRDNKKEKVEEIVLDIALKVAKEGKGALFVIGNIKKNKDYVCMYPNLFEKVRINILKKKSIIPIIHNLSTLDGAVIIKPDGTIVAYGARIKNVKNLQGYGTRHAAARGVSSLNTLAIVASEEHHIVRIFKDGSIIMEINPYTKTVEKNLNKIIRLLNYPEMSAMVAGALGSAVLLGTTAAGAVTATAVLPGVMVFTGGYVVSRKIMNFLEELQKNKS